MDRIQRSLLVFGMLALALGVLLAVLPKTWVESSLGFEPDGGNGAFELLSVLLPLVVGVLLLALAGYRSLAPRQARRREDGGGRGTP